MNKITIPSVLTKEDIFSFECENNTVAKTAREAIIRGVCLAGANLEGADLDGANLESVDLSFSNLRAASLRGANLSKASLWAADLTGADLAGAVLTRTDMVSTSLTNAIIDYACIEISSRTTKVKTDRKLRAQLCNMLLSWMKNADTLDDDEKQIYDVCREYANEFIRIDSENF